LTLTTSNKNIFFGTFHQFHNTMIAIIWCLNWMILINEDVVRLSELIKTMPSFISTRYHYSICFSSFPSSHFLFLNIRDIKISIIIHDSIRAGNLKMIVSSFLSFWRDHRTIRFFPLSQMIKELFSLSTVTFTGWFNWIFSFSPATTWLLVASFFYSTIRWL
jgi:hypothetical protein